MGKLLLLTLNEQEEKAVEKVIALSFCVLSRLLASLALFLFWGFCLP